VSGISEFGLIARYFRPLAAPEGRDLADDAAVFGVTAGHEIVVTADTLVAGVHFFADDPPGMIARKALRVNLSDLAAMGACPRFYTLSLSLPRGTAENWISAFAAGLKEDQEHFCIKLIGGDTTATPGPLSIAITMFGEVVAGGAMGRNGARPGDIVVVSGEIGRGALGLDARLGKDADPGGVLVAHYLCPQPRLGLIAPECVTAAIDVSDGLLQDIGHIAHSSGVDIVIDIAKVPLPDGIRDAGIAAVERCLCGGDDYEIAATVKPAALAALMARAKNLGVALSVIGTVAPGSGQLRLTGEAAAQIHGTFGYRHF
jgi:thiamine-monophosphate kinase